MADETQSPALTASNTIASLTPQPIVAAVKSEVAAEVEKVSAEIETKASTEVAKVEAVVEKVVAEVKEGVVAGENLVRKVIDVVVGSSRIKNPG
jgi:hypothetical protein